MKFLLFFILCFSSPSYLASALNSDGFTLLSLLKHWTFVPPSINSSWNTSDSTPCSWVGVQCDNYTLVVSLNLTASGISGQIGPEIGNLNHLHTIVLLRNFFSGTIPPELGNCSLLEYIDFSDNTFSGHIPYTLKNLKSLKHILLHGNNLSGELPLELTELKNLRNVSLFYNHLSGIIPQSLGINSSLVKLDLMNNNFTGSIPLNLCFGKQLRVLNIGLNQLHGGIPHDVGRCETLERLILNGNNLTGSLPEFEINLNLKYIDMSENNINGSIPSSLGNCTSLTALILSTNVISGIIPSELGNIVNLQALNLAHNKLEGPLPTQLSKCTKMESFDVGFNFLNGSLPSSLRSWTRLNTLVLRENNFSGAIPSFLSEFDMLLELQLGGNMLGGEIPTSMGAMQNLLYDLNLSANGFTGEVPLEIGHLKKLQSLDISLNNLRGSIDVLDELSSLIDVNISYNSFVGPVPKRLMLFMNSSPSSFLGNPGLCVQCLPSNGLNCIKTTYLKACDHGHKGLPKYVILVLELGSSMLVSILLVKLIHMHFSGQISKDEIVDYHEEQKLWSIDSGDHRIIDLIFKREVMKATENLNDRYIIGRGGHGVVYRADLDRFGVFAVKKIVITRNKRKRLSMLREIELVKNLRHQNVARFLGSWIGKTYGLIFTRYVENGTLHDILHENDPLPYLPWNSRYKIAIGIAKGLAYLHDTSDPPILHRDIKPKNILLDYDMKPYITDFGISIALNQSSTMICMRSTYHLGTRGFMAPEIAYTMVPSCMSDVYSYGVVLLELITRKKVLDSSFEEEQTTLVEWFRSVWRKTREFEKIIDQSLASEVSYLDMAEVIKVLLVALICTQKDPGKRMEMRDIVKFFEAPKYSGIIIQYDHGSIHLGNSLAMSATSLSFQDLVFDAEMKLRKRTDISNKQYLVRKVNHDNEVKSMNNDQNTKQEQRTDMSKTIQRNISGSGAYDGGKQLCTAEDYPLTRNANASLSPSNYAPHYQSISLHDVLYERNPLQTLKWNIRYKIAVGIAQELEHFHHECDPPIVHQDINSRNILVDSEMKPHISEPSTSFAREAYTREASVMCDVYNYGVVLLELITMKEVLDSSFEKKARLVGWAGSVWRRTGDTKKIVDSSLAKELSDSSVAEQVFKVLWVALLCSWKEPSKRPTMRTVVKLL